MAEKKIVMTPLAHALHYVRNVKRAGMLRQEKLFHTVECIEDHTINSDLHEFLMTAPYKIESIINTK